MFTQTEIKKYKLSDTNKYIDQLSFQCQNELWIKGQAHPYYHKQQIINHNNNNKNKYEFKKFGKVFGFQINRWISLYKRTLFYYKDQKSIDYQGYCNLQNLYTQFLKTQDDKYILGISNKKQRSVLFFENDKFYQIWNQLDFRHIIQLNYYSKYYISQFIGEGSFANVYKVKNRQTDQLFAAKVIYKIDKKGHQTKKIVLEQRDILTKIPYKCKQAYRMYQFFEQSQKFIMIVDYAPGTQLIKIIKQKENTMGEKQIKLVLREILKGLEVIHRAKILHRDLKPQNIIVDVLNKKVKIIDFGLALYTPNAETRDYKRCGTMGYMAPQIAKSKSQNKKIYNQKCDIFSFGIIAHMLMLGNNPLKGKNYNQTQLNNEQANFILSKNQIVQKYGEDGYSFLSSCLKKEPQKRSSALELLNSSFLLSQENKCHKDQNKNQKQSFNVQDNSSNTHKKQVFRQQDQNIKNCDTDIDFDINNPFQKIQKPRQQSIVKKQIFFS